MYDISPRKRRPGRFKGQIWIDAVSGAELLVSDRFTDFPSAGESVSFVRETKLDAAGYTRVSHVSFSVPLLGGSEVIVTERPLSEKPDASRLRLAGELMHFSWFPPRVIEIRERCCIFAPRLQCRPLEAQRGGCTVGSANLSLCILQRPQMRMRSLTSETFEPWRLGAVPGGFPLNSGIATRSSVPLVKMTERLITFCNSRMLPGQS